MTDRSVRVWAQADAALEEKLAERARRGPIVTCVPVAIERLHSSRDAEEFEVTRAPLGRLEWAPLTAAAAERALETQRALAHASHGPHRIPALEPGVAAFAEAAGPETVRWRLDRDLGRLCGVIGHPHEHEHVPRRR